MTQQMPQEVPQEVTVTRRPTLTLLLASSVLIGAAASSRAQVTSDGDAQAPRRMKAVLTPVGLVTRTEARQALASGAAYLKREQHESGAWLAFDRPHPAVTALALKALAQFDDCGPEDPAVKRATKYLLTHVRPDGGIYVTGDGKKNYHTSVAVMALASLKDERYRKVLEDARDFLIDLQWDSGEGHEADSPFYGGAGYGQHKRPDLSNTQLMLEALHESGLPEDHPVFQKGLAFVSRCQMLDQGNDQPFADESEDGGFVYSAANGGESKAGTETTSGKPMLRSYGSMTYAGFKSMLYAGLDHDDPRVQAAVKWITNHYTLDTNPNMPGRQSQEGLYYFFHTFARALHAWGHERIQDATGRDHDWRLELVAKLAALQKPDGSWVNDQDRWYEGNPHLVTAYAMLTLETVLEDGE